MSLSMPLLLHNWRDIIGVWTTAMESSDDEGLRALLEFVIFSILRVSAMLNSVQSVAEDGA